MVHRWTRGVDLVALLWILRQMLERVRIDRAVLRRGPRPDDVDVGPALDSFSRARLALDMRASTDACRSGRRLLLLSASVGGQRLQAAQPVPALDGARDEVDLGVWTRIPAS